MSGKVYDGSGCPPFVADVRVADGHIKEISSDLQPQEEEEIIDATRMILSPGLIDLHVHVFDGIGAFSDDVRDAGIHTGVTTLLSVDSQVFGSRSYHACLNPTE